MLYLLGRPDGEVARGVVVGVVVVAFARGNPSVTLGGGTPISKGILVPEVEGAVTVTGACAGAGAGAGAATIIGGVTTMFFPRTSLPVSLSGKT